MSASMPEAHCGEPLVAAANLAFRWPGRDGGALSLPSFALARGEHLFVSGPSGSGKTTLLSLLAGVVAPNRGTIRVAGTDLTTSHSASSATPGSTAIKGSRVSCAISRCSAKTRERSFRPTSTAVTLVGVRSKRRRCSGAIVAPGTRVPPWKSRWMACIASSPIWMVRSTGVPVGARMPTTLKGLS